jgi:2-haloalkanoic acid dehalogenase type II
MKLSDFKVLTFDTYGTLIDWETGIWNGLAPLVEKAGLEGKARDEILGIFAQHESAQQEETPPMVYMQLLSMVYRRLAKAWDVKVSDEEANTFGASVPDWPEFPDSARALQYLKKHYKLITLTNCDRLSYRSSNLRLRIEWDGIYTAQDIGSYKPNPRNFEYMFKRLKDDFGFEKRDILHTAQSLFHDHAPANQYGLAGAWIDRRHADKGWGATMPTENMPKIDFRFNSMIDMAKAHRDELKAAG